MDKFIGGVVVGAAATLLLRKICAEEEIEYTNPDQVARFAAQKARNCKQVCDIDCVFNQAQKDSFKGARVVVTGGNRGIGLGLVRELVKLGATVVATCRKSSKDLTALKPAQIIEGIDVCSDASMKKLVDEIGSDKVDILINNAGYFYEPLETLKSLAFEEESKMIEICAVGALRVTAALYNANVFKAGSKIAMITSQGGSIKWREIQNPEGHDYGHHMSKAAANMAGKLLSQELRSENISVSCLHPGFNRTEMTQKYAHIWDIEGAVPVEIGSKRVLHEIAKMDIKNTGRFVNCEDGLDIPW